MTIHQSDFAALRKAQPYPSIAGHVVAVRAAFTVPSDIEAGDIVELLALPSGCDPVDVIFDSDPLDPVDGEMVWDIGLMSGSFGDKAAIRTCGVEFFDGTATSQAGGVARTTEKNAFRIGRSGFTRSIGAKLVTAAGQPVPGVIGLTLFYTAV